MKKLFLVGVLWGLGMSIGVVEGVGMGSVVEMDWSDPASPTDSQLSAMFSQAAPQLSTQLQRVVTVAELHEGYGNGVVKVYYRGLNEDGLQRWEVQYGGGGAIIAILSDEI